MTATLQDRLLALAARHRKAEADMRARRQNSLAAFETEAAQAMEEAATELSRLESACESAVVEIDRLRRQLDLHQAANPAPLGALERAGLIRWGSSVSGSRFVGCRCDECRMVKGTQLWRILGEGDQIQPGDHYASSLTGGLSRCTPDMMGKQLPFMAMPHLRPSGVMEGA
jgi:hypothetical protein